MGVIWAGLWAVVASLIACEIYAQAEPWSRLLIGRAVRRLPHECRERYREEWLAHLYECRGNLKKLIHASACFFCAGTVGRIYENVNTASVLSEADPSLKIRTISRDTRVIAIRALEIALRQKGVDDVRVSRFRRAAAAFDVQDEMDFSTFSNAVISLLRDCLNEESSTLSR